MKRLIDADKLMLSLADWKLQESPISTYPKPKEFTADDMQRMIWRTISDCESAVEEQPIVPAIPVEWIKNYLIPFQVHHDSLSEDSKENDGAGWVIDVLETMIREWEKEMRPDEINKIVEYIKEQTDHKGDIFININNNAIPIEFIERKLAEHWYVDYDVRELLDDWEKEHEKDI